MTRADVSGAAIGIVGLGTMGQRLASALSAAGAHVSGVDPRASAADSAAQMGLTVADGVTELSHCEAVVLSLPTPRVVAEVVAELSAALAAASEPPTVLDTSTIGPADARNASAVLATVGATYADCPILGRPDSVGHWTVPVGGDEEAVTLATRVLSPVAQRIVNVGGTGTAAAAKILNNLMLGTINAVTAELLVLAEAAGLDPSRWVDLIVDSGAASVSPLFCDVATRAVDGNFEPTFSLRLMHKDNGLALGLAEDLDVPMVVGSAAQQLNTMGVAAGHGDDDSIAVIKAVEALTGRQARRHGP